MPHIGIVVFCCAHFVRLVLVVDLFLQFIIIRTVVSCFLFYVFLFLLKILYCPMQFILSGKVFIGLLCIAYFLFQTEQFLLQLKLEKFVNLPCLNLSFVFSFFVF